MFLDICRLVGHPTPVEYRNPDAFTFEKTVPVGSADAYLEEHFGWEFKGSDSQLDEAFTQLLRYSFYLKTPPLLIVSSFQTILIRTNFPGMETVLHKIQVEELTDPDNLKILRSVFFRPGRPSPQSFGGGSDQGNCRPVPVYRYGYGTAGPGPRETGALP